MVLEKQDSDCTAPCDSFYYEQKIENEASSRDKCDLWIKKTASFAFVPDINPPIPKVEPW